MKKIILSFIFVIGSMAGFSQSLYEYTDLSNYRVKVGELVLNGQKMRPIMPLVNQVLMYDGLRWKNQNEKDLIFAADSANIVKYVGNDRDLDMGANSINTDTVKIDGVPLLMNTFKKGNLGGASNIFYSTGASSQPASGSVTDVVGDNYIKNQNSSAQSAGFWIDGNAIADVLKSRVATGTAPLVVASTTKVDNLNVEMLDGKHGSYYQTASPKIKLTPEGGYAVLLTNKTGANSVKGTVVIADPAVDSAFEINPANGDMPFGVVFESGIADGSECWVVVDGIAEILIVDGQAATRSYIAHSSSSVAGRVDTAASVPAADDVHFREIGHTLESKAGGTDILCKCVIHFN